MNSAQIQAFLAETRHAIATVLRADGAPQSGGATRHYRGQPAHVTRCDALRLGLLGQRRT